jgi:PIF1-like helicase
MFVPWENFLSDTADDVDAIWERQKLLLSRRLMAIVGNIQLLRRSAEDAKRDAMQWAVQSGEADPTVNETDLVNDEGEGDESSGRLYKSDEIGSAIRFIDVLRSTIGYNQITAGSNDVRLMVQLLCEFQQVALSSSEDLLATVVRERGTRVDVPAQGKMKSIKSQQAKASREREGMIQGIQEQAYCNAESHTAATYRVMSGFGEDDISIIPPNVEAEIQTSGPSTSLHFGLSTSFAESGKQVAQSLTLNRRQSIAFRLLCRHLDRIHGCEKGTPQLCQFVGGEGGTGKSRIIEALVALFTSKGMVHRLLVTATSGTAAARVNGMTIHAACNISVDSSRIASKSSSAQTQAHSSTNLRVDGRSRMDWQEKDVLVIDEISMLGAKTLHAVNEQLCVFRGSTQDFGGIPIVLFLGDFKQFRPVQERSILVPSSDFSWDEGKTFRVEQRHQHDKAHMLWKRFTTVVMLNEQVRAAGDLQLQRLLTRIRQGVADQSDVDLLNQTCYQEGRHIPWESGITVVTPLNRNRWNLNIEAILSYQKQYQAQLRIFISEHKWKGNQPTEEEALMILRYGDDSSVPVPAIFMFVPGMPVVVNRNTHQGLKLVNGSDYKALNVIIDDAYPGHRISADTILHFGPPAGIILAAESTRHFNFVGMPPGTILLTPLSSKMECVRRRPWQRNEVTRRGLPCTAAFACTDYKVQGRTLKQVALELRGTRTVQICGQVVPSQCDPYSLYVQLSRSQSLHGIMLLSKVRERDIIGNIIPENMVKAEEKLEELSEATIREAEDWFSLN